MENLPQFDIEMLQNSAPYSVPFAQPQSRHYPPHFIPQQPSMYGTRGTTIPPRFLPSYQPPTARRGHFNHYNQPRGDIWCETCDWSFFSVAKLEDHRKQHVKCNTDECGFEGHPKILDKHRELHHSTGLYSKLKSLDSAEDVAKWREERRKNYPTVKNVELRRKAQEEQKKRGERISERKSRFGQRKENQGKEFRSRGKKRRTFGERKAKEPEEVLEKDEVSNQGVPMFTGTATMEDYEVKENPLAKLLSAYGSASESEPEEDAPKDSPSHEITESVEMNDDSTLSEKPQDSPESAPKTEEKAVGEKSRRPKRKAQKTPVAQPKKQTRIYEGLNYEFLRRRQPPTMLSRLLEKEIRHERNVLLQCVRFVVENNFLDAESK